MKALVLKEYKRFAYEDVPTPAFGAEEEVFVSVKACGICGSDCMGWMAAPGGGDRPLSWATKRPESLPRWEAA